MAYRIFFSGLMAFVEYHDPQLVDAYDQVDVLLLNPCARHGAHGHKGKGGTHDHEASCLDRHDPQLLVKTADIADWNLDGVLQGCGRHHFDLKGTVFPGLDHNRRVELSVPESDTIAVDPFGEMQHLEFRTGIVDMRHVLNTNGRIDPALPAKIKKMVVAKVRLPQGKLTALAPLFRVARGLLGWTIGKQKLDVLAEVAMFEPKDQGNLRIEIELGSAKQFVTMRKNPEVTVWITNEPHHVGRTRGGDILKAEHFHHYYDLLATGQISTPGRKGGPPKPPERPEPSLNPPLNIDNPLCPLCLMHSGTPLGGG